jgi:hypothetical protein
VNFGGKRANLGATPLKGASPKKEQIGAFLSGWGHRKGGFGGAFRESKNHTCLSNVFFLAPPAFDKNFAVTRWTPNFFSSHEMFFATCHKQGGRGFEQCFPFGTSPKRIGYCSHMCPQTYKTIFKSVKIMNFVL